MSHQVKFRFAFSTIFGCLTLLLPTLLRAQDSGIHKCTMPDGSVTYQQYECPAGTTGKTIAAQAYGTNTLTLTPNSNHQYSTTLTVNGVTVLGYIDTGATYVSMSEATAARMHLTAGSSIRKYLQTANGSVISANQKLAMIKVGKFELYNVEVAVLPDSPTLIGMTALSQLKFENENGSLVLSKR